jgi:hypothetical protein
VSTNSPPISFRLPVNVRGLVPDQVAEAIENHDDSLVDLNGAIRSLKGQIDDLTTTSSASTASQNVSSTSETIITEGSAVGTVNDQTGNVSYTTQQSDYGAFILLSDASPIAITLASSPVITLPWYATFLNTGTGTATLTPETGTINGSANFSLLGGQVVTVIFDGTNFEITPLLAMPQNAPGVTHEWIASYSSSSGVFSFSQPAIADVSGLSAALALLAPLASPTFSGTVTEPAPPVLTAATTATSATAGAASALPATPLGYLEMVVNSVTVKVPYYSV